MIDFEEANKLSCVGIDEKGNQASVIVLSNRA